MISVSVDFRKTRAKHRAKPGVVFFRICGPTPDGSRKCMSVNTYIAGDDSSTLHIRKDDILALIRLVHHIVETLDRKGQPANVGNVAAFFRSIINDEAKRRKMISRMDMTSPLRADLFAVGEKFHNCLQFAFPKPREKAGSAKDLISFIAYRSEVCRSENRISTSRSYNALSRELRHLASNGAIGWSEVNPGFIAKFADWLTVQGFKDSTQGYYMGMLRTLLFQAKEQGYCPADSEWFREVTTQAIPKPHARERKRMGIDVIRRISMLDLHGNENLAFARDLFMFAFYCRGMELIDVAFLTRGNIQGDTLVYNKRLKGKEMRIPLEKEAASILERYNRGGEYVFPLLGCGRANLFPTKRTWVNNQLKAIGKMVGFPGISFISNIEAWSSMFSSTRITETFLSTAN